MTDAALLEECPLTYLLVIHADEAAHAVAGDAEPLDGFAVIGAEPIEAADRWAAKAPIATVGAIEVLPLAAREMPA